jgi:hypothetical protein
MGMFKYFVDWLEIMKADAGLGYVTVQYSTVRYGQYSTGPQRGSTDSSEGGMFAGFPVTKVFILPHV